MIGNPAGAELLRNGQGDQFIAKLMLAVIALLVGRRRDLAAVHGRQHDRRALPARRLRDRVIPWVFIAPALLLLTHLPRLPGRVAR